PAQGQHMQTDMKTGSNEPRKKEPEKTQKKTPITKHSTHRFSRPKNPTPKPSPAGPLPNS
ncbi:hypothetical protein, partial [Paraburkholderia tropica]|uniref:hypothetical protein n=1 Tax=Paraburkholderia tropica TaxID=92647 RepID=UPI001CC5E772